MKALFITLLLALCACVPSFWGNESSPEVGVYAVDGGWGFSLTGSGTFVANSSREITEFRGPCIRLSTIAGGDKKGLRCKVPSEVEIITKGKILYSVIP